MTAKPKILVLSNYNDYHSVRPEAEIFLSLHMRGYDVTIMTFGESAYAEKFRDAGMKVIDHHPLGKYERKSIKFVRAELIKGKYDVLHLFNNKAIFNGLRAAKRLPVRVVVYRGTSLNFEWYNPFNYLKHLSPSIDYVICNSEGVAKQYRKHKFFDSKKVSIVNKGHELDWYDDVKSIDLRAEYSIPETTPIFILAANDRTVKGVKYLCEAVNLLPNDTDFKLFLVGDGLDAEKYSSILASGKHSDKVIATGPRADALSYIAGADIFVLPSIGGESLTKSVMESMSLGKCPIITNIAGNMELVAHEVNGLVVPIKNAEKLVEAILQLCNNRELIRKYGLASKQKITKDLSHENTVVGYEKFYEQIM